MINIITDISQLSFSQWMSVYEESLNKDAKRHYLNLDRNVALLYAQQDLYSYLESVFFSTKGAAAAVWLVDGAYVSALRFEPYQDGYLITAMETKPCMRGKGFAQKLLGGVSALLFHQYKLPIYSHVHRDNSASIACHRKCGFVTEYEHALFLDGSFHPECSTMIYKEI